MQYFITLSESKHDISLTNLRADLLFAPYGARYINSERRKAIMQEAQRLALIHGLAVVEISAELEDDAE